MQAFVDFIQAYFPYLSAGLMILIEVLSIILKKRPKTLDDFKYLLSQVSVFVPDLIIGQEVPGNGAAKKEAVILSAIETFKSHFGRSLSDEELSFLRSYFSDLVEVILSTPQKKGVTQ